MSASGWAVNTYPDCDNILKSSIKNKYTHEFILTVNINGKALPDYYEAVLTTSPERQLVLELQAWKSMNLILKDSGVNLGANKRGFALESIPDLSYRLNCSRQHIVISAPSSAFVMQEFTAQNPEDIERYILETFGGYVNYDLNYFLSRDLDQPVLNAQFNSVFFTPSGSLVHQFAYNDNEMISGLDRIATYFQKDFNEYQKTLVIGDSTTTDGVWSRSAYYAGIRFGTEHELQPQFLTYPGLSVQGAAAVPSSVDVLLDGDTVLSQLNVDAGYFMLDNLPLKSGARSLDLRLRDNYGREYSVSSSYYLSTALLKKDLVDFSFEAGELRKANGPYDYIYEDPFIATSIRKGINNRMTLGMRTEVSEFRQAFGMSMDHNFFNQGVFSSAFAWTYAEQQQNYDELGFKSQFAFERTSQLFNFNVFYEYADANFTPFAFTAGEVKTKNLFMMNVGTGLFGKVATNFNIIHRSSWNMASSRYGNLVLSTRLANGVLGGLNLSKSFQTADDWYLGAYVMADFSAGQHYEINQRISQSSEDNLTQLSYRNSKNENLQQTVDLFKQNDTGGRYNLTHTGQYRRSTLEAYSFAGQNSLRLSTSGSYVFFYDTILAAPPLYTGSFALIKAGDLEGLDIYHNNQKVAQTNKNGVAVLANLYPNQLNNIAIDPDAMPIEYTAEKYDANLTVSRLSGSIVNFNLKKGRSLLLSLKLDNGEDVPVGSKVYLYKAESEYYLIGKKGMLYIPQAPDVLRGRVSWEGGSCRIVNWQTKNLTVEEQARPYICRRVSWDRSIE